MSIQSHNEDFYRFKIGRFDCISVGDGSFDYNPGILFPGLTEDQVKELLSDYGLPTDKIRSPYTYLYVDTGEHKILTDMGAGKLGPNTGKLINNLR